MIVKAIFQLAINSLGFDGQHQQHKVQMRIQKTIKE
jgi:hypothetical protein